MRVDMRKFLFVGMKKDKKHFFEVAQKYGIAEFKEPPKNGKTSPLQQSPEVEKFSRAIRILRGFVLQDQEIRKDLKLANKILNEVLDTKNRLDTALDELNKLEQERDLVKPFGSFSLEVFAPIETTTKRKAFFYFAKSNKRFDETCEDLILVNSINGIDYFLTFTEKPLEVADLFVLHIKRTHDKVEEEIIRQKEIIAEKEAILKDLTKYVWVMHFGLINAMNGESLNKALKSPEGLFDDALFFIEAWVPDDKINELKALYTETHVYAKEIAIEKHDIVPTQLVNEGYGRIGEDLIGLFDIPSAKDKDPSIWVLTAFSLFFAMIVGDAGYGLVFLFAALMMHLKTEKKKGATKRFILLTAILGSSCFAWGVLTDSFFGIPFGPNNPLHKTSALHWLIEKKATYHFKNKDAAYTEWVKKIPAIEQATNAKEFLQIGEQSGHTDRPEESFKRSILMELALLIGSIHVILGIARYLVKKPGGAGWIAFIIGAYLYLPSYLHCTSLVQFACGLHITKAADFGLQLLIGGIVFSTLTAISLEGFHGIFEALTVIQVFSDILSYLRIFALGLAGAIIGELVNHASDQLPTVVAIILAIFGHGLNIMLSIMGGVIHGLRLNFLEWYRYSFEGGGKSFKPLELHVLE